MDPLNGPSLLYYSYFDNFHVTQKALSSRPLCSPTFASCIGKYLHALYLTNLSIVQFYFRFMDFVLFAKYAIVTVSLSIQYSGKMAFGMGIKVLPIPGYCH